MKSVLITGASSGFGLLSTIEMARRGWRVFATMRDLEKKTHLDNEVQKLKTEARGVVEVIKLDVTDNAEVNNAIARILEKCEGRLDAVVQNAGIVKVSVFEEMTECDIRKVMDTNFHGVLSVTKAVLPAMRKQGKGRVVMMSSSSAFAGEPMNSIYCASKFAIEGWAESLAYEVSAFNIDVVLIEPGAYRTRMWNEIVFQQSNDSHYAYFTKQVEKAARNHALRTARDPQEVADKVAHCLEIDRPRFRNPVGPVGFVGWLFKGKLPSALIKKMMERYLRIHKIKPAIKHDGRR